MTDMAHANDQVSIADGQITLYRRDDVRDALWQCRIKMKGHRGYIRRSTGQKELEKAEQAAWQILGELTQRTAQNLPLKNKNFTEVASSFLRDTETRFREGRTSEGRFLVVDGTLKRYLLPFFGRKEITLIQKKELMEYRKWRQDYWLTGPKGSTKPNPANMCFAIQMGCPLSTETASHHSSMPQSYNAAQTVTSAASTASGTSMRPCGLRTLRMSIGSNKN